MKLLVQLPTQRFNNYKTLEIFFLGGKSKGSLWKLCVEARGIDRQKHR